MRTLSAVASVMVLLSVPAQFLLARPAPQNSEFQAVQVASVTALSAPYQTLTSGIVVLTVSVSDGGKVQDVKVQNGVASLTQAAVSSVEGWTFKPATVDGNAVASAITVVAVFNTQCLYTPGSAVTAESKERPGPVDGFQPAALTSADVPPCPYGATLLSAGTTLQASVDSSGNVTAVRALQHVPPYTAAATRSVNSGWKFAPAKLDGNAVDSNVVIAFFFRQAATAPAPVK